MKKLSFIMLLTLACVASASAQQIEIIFEKYMEDIRFRYIYDGSDINKVDKHGLKNNGKKMLTLDGETEKSLIKTFQDEVDNAVKADNYKNTSYVRHDTNRVMKYVKETPDRKDEVTFIQNSDQDGLNILLIWESFLKDRN